MPRKVSTRAARIWNRLGQWYGSRWGESYGPSPPDEWGELIDRTDDERLEAALSAARHQSPVHPFTLGQVESALPKRRDPKEPTPASLLCKHVMDHHALCVHQTMRPWSYFGPEPIDIKGVVVPECQPCGKRGLRVKLDEIMTEGVAA